MSKPADLIREYRPDDRQEIEQCLAELQDFSKLIHENMAPGAVAPRYLQHLLIRCRETNGMIFVAESEGRIAGLVCVFASVRSEAVDEEDHEYAYISDLVLLPDQRNKGVGRLLLQRAEEHAKSQGATLLRLNVLAQNEVARGLYNRYGFAELVVAMQKKL